MLRLFKLGLDVEKAYVAYRAFRANGIVRDKAILLAVEHSGLFQDLLDL